MAALWLGLSGSDYARAHAILGHLAATRSASHWWEIFGVPASRGPTVGALIEKGVLPWWASEHHTLAFFRPLSAASHYVDYWLLGGDPAWMHAHNVAWYALLTALVALCHRRLLGSASAASVASMLYLVDAAHSEGLALLSGRSTLIAACASVGALLLHDHGRRARNDKLLALAALSTGIGLCSSETGLAVWGLLIAYEVVLSEAGVRDRLRALSPHAAATFVWSIVYKTMGYGADGSGVYVDPSADPLGFINCLPARFVMSWLDLFGVSGFVHGDSTSERALFGVGVMFCAAMMVFAVRSARVDRHVRFWLLASALTLLPYCSVPHEARLLFTPGLAAAALLALPVAYVIDYPRRQTALSTPVCMLAAVCLIVRLVVGVATIPAKFSQLEAATRKQQMLASTLPVAAADGASKTVIVLNTASYAASSATLSKGGSGATLAGFYVLGGSEKPVWVTRISESVIELASDPTFLTEHSALLLRHPRERFALDEHHHVGPADLHVSEVSADGQVIRIELELADADDPRFIWTYWSGAETGYLAVTLPPLGTSVKLPMHRLAERVAH